MLIPLLDVDPRLCTAKGYGSYAPYRKLNLDCKSYQAQVTRSRKTLPTLLSLTRQLSLPAWTFRKPSKKHPFGRYQVRCYHHDPCVRVNCSGREYKLACRKEMGCSSEEDAPRVLRKLQHWVEIAPAFDSRLEHLAQTLEDLTSSSSDSSPNHSPAAVQSHGVVDLVEEPAVPAQGPLFNVAQAQAVCWVCAGHHSTSDCLVWKEAMRQSLISSAGTDGRQLPSNRDAGLLLPPNAVQVKDVSGDGTCFFHAFFAEANHVARATGTALPRGIQSGHDLRQTLLTWAKANPASRIGAHCLSSWVELLTENTLAEWVRQMSGSDSVVWGGFLETSRVRVRARFFSVCQRLLYLNWTGKRWQRHICSRGRPLSL